jgi:protease I
MFPGGFSPDHLRIHEPTLELVRQCYKEGKLIAAICHGPWILVSAGIAKGRRVTSYKAIRDDLINAGCRFEDVPAIRDGNIITGRVPDDLPEFCREIIQALTD